MLTTITAIAGLFIGLLSLTLSILNYRRDRSKVSVKLQWDSVLASDDSGKEVKLGQIYVTNRGRRSVFITTVGLRLDTHQARFIVQRPAFSKGRKLNEGDSPIGVVVPDNDKDMEILKENAIFWREVRAYAEDSTGTVYLSPKVKYCPSWGKGGGKVPRKLKGGPWYLEYNIDD